MPAKISRRLRQPVPKNGGRFVNILLSCGGMIFCSMASIIRQALRDRQASEARL